MTAAPTPETTTPVTVYATSWCPFCAQLVAELRKAELPDGTVTVIDLDSPGTEDVSAWVEFVNNGNRVVPTVLYSDGSHATNPPAAEVLAKVSEL